MNVFDSFSPFDQIQLKLQQFQPGTRQWLFDAVNEWYSEPVSKWSRVFVLLGYAGVGKSVFLSELCRSGGLFLWQDENKSGHSQMSKPFSLSIIAAHAFQHDDNMANSLQVCIVSVGRQLSQNLELPADYSFDTHLKTALEISEGDMETLFVNLVCQIASNAKKMATKQVVVIDALDECEIQSRPILLAIIQTQWMNNMPEWIGLIVSSRPEDFIPYQLRSFKPTILDTENESNNEDIRRFFHSKLLDCMEAEKLHIEEGLDILVQRSEGLFLYARFLEDMIRYAQNPQDQEGTSHKLTLDMLRDERKFPMGLTGVYTTFFHRFQVTACEGKRKYRKILGPVVIAREPLPIDIWCTVSGYDGIDLFKKTVVEKAKNLLYVANGQVRVLHKSMSDFLLGKQCNRDLKFSAKKAHSAVSQFCVDNERHPYSLRHLLYHLCRAKQFALAKHYLSSRFDWISGVWSLSQLVEDASLYKGEDGQLIDTVTNALRLSITSFSKDRKELASQVYGRLGGLSVELTEQAYAKRPAGIFPIFSSLTDAASPLRLRFNKHSQSITQVCCTDVNILRRESTSSKLGTRIQVCASLCGNTGRVYVWNTYNGSVLYEINAGTRVNCIKFSRSGEFLCVDNKVFGTISGVQSLRLSIENDKVSTITVSRLDVRARGAEEVVLLGYGRKTKVFVLNTGDPLFETENPASLVSAAAISPFHYVHRRDFMSDLVLPGRNSRVPGYNFSCDPDIEQTVAVGYYNKSIQVFDLNGDLLHEFRGHSGYILKMEYSSDRRKLYSVDNKSLHIWDMSTLSPLRSCLIGIGTLEDFSIHPDAGFPAIVTTGPRSMLQLWDVDKGRLVASLAGGHRKALTAVCFSSDGKSIISGSKDTTASVWDLRNFLKQNSILDPSSEFTEAGDDPNFWTNQNFRAGNFAFSSEGDILVLGSLHGDVRLINCFDGSILADLEGHNRFVDVVATGQRYSGERIAVTGSLDKRVIVWDLDNRTQLKALGPGERSEEGNGYEVEGHTGYVHDIKISNSGNFFVSCGGDRSIIVWNMRTFKIDHRFREPFSVNCVAISPDENYVVSGSRGVVRIFDLNTIQEVVTKYAHMESVESVAWSSNGNRIASCAGQVIQVYFFDGVENKLVQTHSFANPSGMKVHDLRFTREGRALQSMSKHDTAITWNLEENDAENDNSESLIYLEVEENIHVRPRKANQAGFTTEAPVRFAAVGPRKTNGERTGLVIEGHKVHLMIESA